MFKPCGDSRPMVIGDRYYEPLIKYCNYVQNNMIMEITLTTENKNYLFSVFHWLNLLNIFSILVFDNICSTN